MTRDELKTTLDRMSDCIEHQKKAAAIIAHDAEQRAMIEKLEEKVKAYEGGCLHDSLVDQACTIEQQAQEIARLREALEGILEIGKRDMTNPKYDVYFEQAQQALKELK